MSVSTAWRVAVDSASPLSSGSAKLLQSRGLNEIETTQFSTFLEKFEESDLSGTAFLKSLTPSELQTVQKANALAKPIAVGSFSEEGATNLFARPDGSNLVDLNNDGFVEVGDAKKIYFPSVNSPKFVKGAWEEATEEYNEVERAVLDLSLHGMVYGIQIKGAASKTPPSPESLWSRSGIDELFTKLYANLDYRVSHDGWTEHNLRLKAVYEKFESSLLSSLSELAPQNAGVIKSTLSRRGAQQAAYFDNKQLAPATRSDQVVQLLFDAKIDSDRNKIDVLEKKKGAIMSDTSLSQKEKAEAFRVIQSEVKSIIEKTRKRFSENEKRRSVENEDRLGNEKLGEQLLKQIMLSN